ncbi:helix-turn-helix transcriptional regulator [Zooshikella harenae]|uniref:PAS domain-containing protein n=1 Tax=Zooshikella harenae TaxID=2827238 RepID=A0ABS5ZH97_9GAMM|nr:PAS domain-containing protein [Zooshikella harenae]MBU2713248.1 PAS domain-containing protein [Zooshikella harenae]
MKKQKLINDHSTLLTPYFAVADGIAALYHPYAEVVIHSLATDTVVYVANNFSKRELNEKSNLDETQFDPEQTVIGPYEKLNWDGRKLKSISVLIKTPDQKNIGLLCINLDVSAMNSLQQALQLFLKPESLVPQPDELFQDDWQEKINVFVHDWLRSHQLTLNTLSREDKKELVATLFEQGAFQKKNAAEYIANIIGLSRATVFNYLKVLR